MLSDFQTHFWSTFQSFYADGDNQLDVKEKRASIVLDNLQLHQSGLWISLGVRAPAWQVPDRSRTRTGAYRTCPVLRFYPTSTRNWISGRSLPCSATPFHNQPMFPNCSFWPSCLLVTTHKMDKNQKMEEKNSSFLFKKIVDLVKQLSTQKVQPRDHTNVSIDKV